MINEIKADAAARMGKSVQALAAALKKLRTGRAHPSLVEHLTVDYYGAQVPLNQVANVVIEDARTLSITPWEKQMVPVIEKAIMNANLGLNPNTAGTVIRVPLPALTEERRRDLARVVKQEAEQGRVAVRNVRRDALNDLRDALKEKLINEDEERHASQLIQDLTDSHIAEVDKVSEDKQKEIMDF